MSWVVVFVLVWTFLAAVVMFLWIALVGKARRGLGRR